MTTFATCSACPLFSRDLLDATRGRCDLERKEKAADATPCVPTFDALAVKTAKRVAAGVGEARKPKAKRGKW